ncbi:MAG: hypothetical protein HY683_05945 [Chloroflexi bacterium]|nr:hypothetical protein [Chloroflexota bacterium]
MTRPIAEEIARGRRAIALAQARGRDTAPWEQYLAYLEQQALLAWASELAERDLVLSLPISYVEAPLRTVTTTRVSWYAAHYLKTIASARLYREYPKLCWGQWTPPWWQGREEDALGALAALREALSDQDERET